MDLSGICADAVCAKGHKGYKGTLADPPREQYDFVVLSHVLEHVIDARGAIEDLMARVKPDGLAYIEVPDAERYTQYDAPFLDFNSQHINHFGKTSLKHLMMQSQLQVIRDGTKDMEMTNLSDVLPVQHYPAMWVLVSRNQTPTDTVSNEIKAFIEKSKKQLARINEYLEAQLAGVDEVIIWGQTAIAPT